MKPQLPDSITKAIEAGKTAYENILYDYLSFDIDCKNLPDPNWIKNGGIDPAVAEMLARLPAKNTPCLYYFEILSPDTSTILSAYKTFKYESEHSNRASAALKKYPPLSSNILYVGKVKRNIEGRLYVHLGYYYVKATAGLQLVCWGRNIGLNLRFHLFLFEPPMKHYVTPLEQPFARDLKPLIGKH